MTWELDTAPAPLHTAHLPPPRSIWRRRGASLDVAMQAVLGQLPAMEVDIK